MSKITLTDLTSLENENTAIAAINNNSDIITAAIDNTLSRDGESPNEMKSNLDMNNFQILNLPTPATNNSPLRLQDLVDFTGGGSVSNIPAGGITGQALVKESNTDYDTGWGSTVTSVGLAANSDFTVTNTPITTAGNINLDWSTIPTGTGALVKANNPQLVIPNIGDAVANTVKINGATLTAGATAATVTIPNSTDTLVGRSTIDTLTNKSIDGSQITGSIPASTIPNSAVTNARLANMNAYTIKGNSTGSAAAPTDISIPSLTNKASPVSGDMLLIVDSAASNALKYATVGSVSSAGSVASVGGLTGVIGLTSSDLATSGSNIQLSAGRRTLPTVQTFTSGSGTYTTPANCLWIRIRLVGGGGGGGGAGTSPGTGGNGGASTFSGGTLSAGGGFGGNPTTDQPGVGGNSSGGNIANVKGGQGGGSAAVSVSGGVGGNSYFGGSGAGGRPGAADPGLAGGTNTGGGGGGATISGAAKPGGGGAGYCEHILVSPGASYSYSVGAAGTAGAAGGSGAAGGAGGSGLIIVEEYYN